MNERDYKLDILKALAIVLVLIWHLQPIRIFPIDNMTIPLSKKILGQLYQKTLVAVPIFYFVSMLLFFKKNEMSNSYIQRRLKRIFTVFIFWSFVQTSIYFIAKEGSSLLHLHFASSLANSKLWWWIVMGGPSLPAVGDSVFYFLFNLFLLTIFAFIYNKFASKHLDLCIFLVLSFYIFVHQFFKSIPYWRIDNFLIYIPISHFIAKKYYHSIISVKPLMFSLCLYLMFSITELLSRKIFNTTHSAYDINSLQWGVISLFILIHIITLKRNKIVEWLACYSLGLFALHKYWLLFFLFLFSEYISKMTITFGDSVVKYIYVVVFILTLTFTYITIKIMLKNKALRIFIS